MGRWQQIGATTVAFLRSFYKYSDQCSPQPHRGGLTVPLQVTHEDNACCGEGSHGLDGNGADNDAILQHHAEHQENKVEQEHGGTQHLVHLPFAGCDGDDDKEKHDEEQHDGTEEAVAADGHWSQTVEE